MSESNLITDHNSPVNVTWQTIVPIDQSQYPIGSEASQESRPQNALHDEKGNFAVGNPGGPGRPPTKRISDAYRRILNDEGADKYAAVVAKDALEAGKARDRLAAIQELTDRVEGKAVQSIRHAGVFMVMAPGAESLAALDSWAEDE